ncbi:putative transcription factor/ chromatin remodeling BED-type(Zn) family [Helianthus debilis subsp. tardiflorus]
MEMKNVYYRKRKRKNTKQIDRIPKFSQLPRTASAPKSRYLPICSIKDVELDSYNSKDIQSSVTIACSDMSNDTIKVTLDPLSSRSTGPECRRRKTQTNDLQLAVTDAKLPGQKAQPLQYKECSILCKGSCGLPEVADGVNHHDQVHEIRTISASSTPSSTSISTDPARKYGTQDPTNRNNISCNYCGKVVKGGVYRLKQHFVGGFRNVTVCLRCPEHVREEMKIYMQKKEMSKVENVMNSRIRVNEYDLDDTEEDCSEAGGSMLPRRKKTRVKGFTDIPFTQNRKQTFNEVCNKELRDKACTEIAKWFYDVGIPSNAATYDSFNAMIEAVGQFGPGMKPPSMYELRVPLLNEQVKEVDNQVNEQRKEWANKGCSILCDEWHDPVVKKDIINFMVNSPKGSVFIKSIDVSNVSKDASVLYKILDAMVEEVGEDNVIQVVTDNASAYVEAGKMLEANRKHLYWTPCATRCLDLMLEDIGKQIPRVKSCLKNAMFANGYIHNFVGLVNLMRKFTNQRNLHRPAITRFATSFITLLQYHKQKNNLRKMIISQEWVDSKWSKNPKGKKLESIFLQESFWRNIVYTLKLTGPLVSLLRLVAGEKKLAMGYMYNAMDKAKETIRKSFNKKKEFYDKTFDIIDNRWECQLNRPLHAAGHYLNPSIFYDDVKLILEDEEIMDDLYSCIERLSPTVEDEDLILEELSKYQNAEGLFGKNAAIRQRKQKAPVEWWASFGYSAPKLQQFAIRVLNLTCTATTCEKIEGLFQHLHTKKRNRLAQERLNDTLYVKFNRALERRHRSEGPADPILVQDLDESNEWLMGRMEDDLEDDDLVFIGDDLTWSNVGRASKVISDDGSGPSKDDKGKRRVEDEIEEDIGASGDEGDEPVLGSDDED